jgi:hypothetical protein
MLRLFQSLIGFVAIFDHLCQVLQPAFFANPQKLHLRVAGSSPATGSISNVLKHNGLKRRTRRWTPFWTPTWQGFQNPVRMLSGLRH